MKKLIYSFVLLFLMFGLNAQKSILFVGNDGTISGTPDYMLIAEIENSGNNYSVTFLPEADFASYTDASAYSGYDAVFFSESVGSGSVVPYRTAGYPIPCVTTEGFATRVDRWNLLSDNATQHKQLGGDDKIVDGLSLIITNNSHFITSLYGYGSEVAWSSNTDGASDIGPTGFKIDENIPAAIPLADNKNTALTGFPAFWAIPDGATPNNAPDTILPRIVIMGVVTTGLGTYATIDFNQLMVQSLKWVMNDIPSGIEDNMAQKFNLIASPNPAGELVNIAFTLHETSNVEVSLYDLTGRLITSVPAQQYSLGDNKITVNLPAMANALYIYELDINGIRVQGKLEVVQ